MCKLFKAFCIIILFGSGCSKGIDFDKTNFVISDLNIEMIYVESLNIWVSSHEISVGQFKEFIHETNYKTTSEINQKTLTESSIKNIYESLGFKADSSDDRYILGLYWANAIPQIKDNMPAECISGIDATQFCIWLSKKEHKNKCLPDTLSYRLPSIKEWQAFASCGDEDRIFPWGNDWPPSDKSVNLLDETIKSQYNDKIENHVENYSDNYVYSSPIDSLFKNDWDLYNVGGNVTELVTADPNEGAKGRVHRMGGSWAHGYWPVIGIYPYVTLTDSYDEVSYTASGFRIVLANIPSSKNNNQ